MIFSEIKLGWCMIKNSFKIIKIVLLILLILFTVGVTYWGIHQRNEKIRWKSNYKAKINTTTTYKDSFGRTVKRVNELSLSNRELKNIIHSKDSILAKMGTELASMKIKVKRAKNLLFINLNSIGAGKVGLRDSIILVFKDSIFTDTIKVQYAKIQDDWLFLEIIKEEDSLQYNYFYKEEIFVVSGTVKKKLKENGKKYFFLRRWLGWLPKENVVDVKSLNPNSNIKTVVKIKKI